MSYKRTQQEKAKIRKLVKARGNRYMVPVYFDHDKNRYVRVMVSDYRGRGTVAAFKKASRKIIRKKLKANPDIQFKGWESNKLYDLWWTLY